MKTMPILSEENKVFKYKVNLLENKCNYLEKSLHLSNFY